MMRAHDTGCIARILVNSSTGMLRALGYAPGRLRHALQHCLPVLRDTKSRRILSVFRPVERYKFLSETVVDHTDRQQLKHLELYACKRYTLLLHTHLSMFRFENEQKPLLLRCATAVPEM